MSIADEARASLIHMLFDQVPEDWDENDIGILADAIEEWQASRKVETAPSDTARYEPCVVDANGECTRWSHDHARASQPVQVEVTDDRTKCALDADGRMVAKPHDPCPIKVHTKAGNWVTTLPMSALGFHMPHEVQEFAPGVEFCQCPGHYFTALSAALDGGES